MLVYKRMTEEQFKELEKEAKDTLTREHIWRINHICPHTGKICIEGACAAFRAPIPPERVPVAYADDPISRWWRKKRGTPGPSPFYGLVRSAECNIGVFDRSSQFNRR